MSTTSSSSTALRALRNSRTMRAGQSLLSSGEPAVWLTGGAMVFCIAMIAGLMTYVVYCGLVAFWPAPVEELQLLDGQRRMGAPVRSEEFQLTAGMVEGMPAKTADVARKHLDGKQAATSRRTLYRTGNNEITGTHFHWVSDFEIAGRTTGPWAVAIERTSWGRFYGYPESFVLNHPRIEGDAEKKLVAAIQYFEKQKSHLAKARQTKLDEALTPVHAELDTLRLQRSRQFVNVFRSDTSTPSGQRATRLQVKLADGRTFDLASDALKLLPGDNVRSVTEHWDDPADAWREYRRHHPQVLQRTQRITSLAKHRIGALNQREEEQRLAVRQAEIQAEREQKIPPLHLVSTNAELLKELQLELGSYKPEAQQEELTGLWIDKRYGKSSQLAKLRRELQQAAEKARAKFAATPRKLWRMRQQELEKTPDYAQQAVARYLSTVQQTSEERQQITNEIETLENENNRCTFVMRTVSISDTNVDSDSTQLTELKLDSIVRAYRANHLTTYDKFAIYFSRWLEFLTAGPREANSQGGVFPAIWGTVAMTMIMTIMVVPFGVLAALYLREYATNSLLVSCVRIAIHNLAGVPSIVFGVFGLGFFCYIFGAYIDGGPAAMGVQPWPPAAWFLCLAVLAIVGAGGFFLGMISRTSSGQSRIARWAPYLWFGVWVAALILAGMLIIKTPFFHGFFAARLPAPTFGKGGLFWASLTLALLTAPVVIVATEEALSAVPNSLREGSYACGASKWQTIRRIVLPHAAPGIITGAILAMARGAGEVAPLMLTGAVKLAPDLPVDASAPFIHWERSFMHLGFHIYDLGFQSPNAEAAKPMVFTTTLLLIAIVAILNLSAVWLRARLRKQFQSSHF